MTDKQQILTVIKEHLGGRGIPVDKVTPEAQLGRDLDLDSLDTVELTLGIEEAFGIEIPDAELDGLVSVQDAIDLVEKKLEVHA